MAYEDKNVDELISDIHSMLGDRLSETEAQMASQPDPKPVSKPVQTETKDKKPKKKKKKSFARKLLTFFGKLLLILLETVLLAVVVVYALMFILAKGPSAHARDLFITSVRETSALDFLANLFYTEEEIQAMMPTAVEENSPYMYTGPVEIQIVPTTKPTDPETGDAPSGPQPDAWGLIDEDGDGIIIQDVKGEGFVGKMMVILDPSRVVMGSDPSAYGSHGYTVASMVKRYDGIAGINAGGFEDPNGQGNGSEPNTLVVYEGKTYYASKGCRDGFVGIDSNNILHVATKITTAQIKEKDIQYGVCFGPVLVTNGEACNFDHLVSGVNPRTAIGQRLDGAILMLVIDGRQVISLGATYADLAEVFLDYGAVNACNLDGGSSTIMYYDGEYINNCASVVGIRPVPTTFVVLKEGVSNGG